MKLLGSLTALKEIILAGSGGNTTLQPSPAVAAPITITLPTATGTLRTVEVPIIDSDIDSIAAAKLTGVVAKANGGCGADMSSVTFPSSGTLATVVSTTQAITFTQTGGYSKAVTANYTKVGKIVTLTIPAFSGTCTASSAISAAVANTALLPAVDQTQICVAIADTTKQLCTLELATSGSNLILNLYANMSGGSFTSAKTGGLTASWAFTYEAAS